MTYAFESTPEDAWHPEDAVLDQVRNLYARCALLDGGRRLAAGVRNTHVGQLDELVERVLKKMKQRDLDHRDRVRAELILEDVETVRAKFGGQ